MTDTRWSQDSFEQHIRDVVASYAQLADTTKADVILGDEEELNNGTFKQFKY